jgi:hypothetical protein
MLIFALFIVPMLVVVLAVVLGLAEPERGAHHLHRRPGHGHGQWSPRCRR